MRKPFIAGNWKMYRNLSEAKELASALKAAVGDFFPVDVALCPPSTNLSTVSEAVKGTNIKVGAQNLYWEAEGAYTGEISAGMIASCGAEYVIIGHSERRKYFAETDETVNHRLKAALIGNLKPIVCIGEVLEEREADKTIDVVKTQLEGALGNLRDADMAKVTIAYEPVWAIGTGKTATPQQAQEVHKFIRMWLAEKFSGECADAIRILYGGSVKPENIAQLMKEEDIDGALVGGASLKKDSFVAIVKGAVDAV